LLFFVYIDSVSVRIAHYLPTAFQVATAAMAGQRDDSATTAELASKVHTLEEQLLEAETRFQNNLRKLEKVEQGHQKDLQGLRSQLSGKSEQLRNLLASRTGDLALSDRESKLKAENEKLKREVSRRPAS
jgi:myosin heavy subunit